MSSFINRRVFYLCLYILSLLAFQCWVFFSQIEFILFSYPKFYSKLNTEGKKHFFVDRAFYDFIELCKKKIPQHSTLYCVRKKKSENFTPEWEREEYFRQKLVYYLYPRKIIYLDSYYHIKPDEKVIESHFLPYDLVY